MFCFLKMETVTFQYVIMIKNASFEASMIPQLVAHLPCIVLTQDEPGFYPWYHMSSSKPVRSYF